MEGKRNLSRALVTKDDVKFFLNTGIATEVTEAPTIAANSWAWSTPYNAVHINQTTTTFQTTTFHLGFLKMGDVIKASCEALNVSGTKVKVLIYFSAADPDVLSGAQLLDNFIQSSKDDGQFEQINLDIITEKTGYYKVVFGMATGDAGEFYLRDCAAVVETFVSPQTYRYREATKHFAIKTTATGVFELDKTYICDDATFSINSAGKEMTISFTRPFLNSGFNPIAIIQEKAFSNSPLYDIRVRAISRLDMRIIFYNKGTTTAIDPALIPSVVEFTVSVFGHEVITRF